MFAQFVRRQPALLGQKIIDLAQNPTFEAERGSPSIGLYARLARYDILPKCLHAYAIRRHNTEARYCHLLEHDRYPPLALT